METVSMKHIKPLKEHVDDVVQCTVHEISEIYKKPHASELELLELIKRGHELNQDPDEILLHLLVEKVSEKLYYHIPDIKFTVGISNTRGSHRMMISCRELEMCYIVVSECDITMNMSFNGGRRHLKTEVHMDVFKLNILRADLFTESHRLDVTKTKD